MKRHHHHRRRLCHFSGEDATTGALVPASSVALATASFGFRVETGLKRRSQMNHISGEIVIKNLPLVPKIFSCLYVRKAHMKNLTVHAYLTFFIDKNLSVIALGTRNSNLLKYISYCYSF
jgi:hypothetical protein